MGGTMYKICVYCYKFVKSLWKPAKRRHARTLPDTNEQQGRVLCNGRSSHLLPRAELTLKSSVIITQLQPLLALTKTDLSGSQIHLRYHPCTAPYSHKHIENIMQLSSLAFETWKQCWSRQRCFMLNMFIDKKIMHRCNHCKYKLTIYTTLT